METNEFQSMINNLCDEIEPPKRIYNEIYANMTYEEAESLQRDITISTSEGNYAVHYISAPLEDIQHQSPGVIPQSNIMIEVNPIPEPYVEPSLESECGDEVLDDIVSIVNQENIPHPTHKSKGKGSMLTEEEREKLLEGFDENSKTTDEEEKEESAVPFREITTNVAESQNAFARKSNGVKPRIKSIKSLVGTEKLQIIQDPSVVSPDMKLFKKRKKSKAAQYPDCKVPKRKYTKSAKNSSEPQEPKKKRTSKAVKNSLVSEQPKDVRSIGVQAVDCFLPPPITQPLDFKKVSSSNEVHQVLDLSNNNKFLKNAVASSKQKINIKPKLFVDQPLKNISSINNTSTAAVCADQPWDLSKSSGNITVYSATIDQPVNMSAKKIIPPPKVEQANFTMPSLSDLTYEEFQLYSEILVKSFPPPPTL